MALINEHKKNQNKKKNQKKAVDLVGPLQQLCHRRQVPCGSVLGSVWGQASTGRQQAQLGAAAQLLLQQQAV